MSSLSTYVNLSQDLGDMIKTQQGSLRAGFSIAN